MAVALDALDRRKEAIENAAAALQIFEQIEDPHVERVRRRLNEWRNKQ